MFHSYLFPISYAFLTFPLAALLFTLPFLIVQYRRHGYINKVRALMLYLLLLYLMNAFYLVMLPLPASRHNSPPSFGEIQHIPLYFIQDILKDSNFSVDQPATYLSILSEPTFLQIVFNMVLMMPFGMFLSYYFRTRWVVCILLSFGISLFFEITQITGIYGYFDYPYRVFDVDDLIINTLGGIIGFQIAGWISGLLPRIENLDSKVDLSAKRITYTRRGIAFLLDSCVWITGFLLLSILHIKGAFWIATGIYFMLIPYLTNGRTLGKWIVRIQLTGRNPRLSLGALIVRYGLLYWVLFGLHLVLFEPYVIDNLSAVFTLILQILVLIIDSLFLIHLISRVFTKNNQLLYERLSRTSHAISWPKQQLHTDAGTAAKPIDG